MSDAAAPRRLTDAQRLNWLRLIRSENVGPATFRDLINRYGSAGAALDALPDLAARGGRRIKVATAQDAQRELDAVAHWGGRIVAVGEEDYPSMLRHADPPPPMLTIMGASTVFAQPTVAIVGARNASAAGTSMARKLAGELGRQGFAVASGIARGIDAAAHWASLETGTIGVLAGGLDKPYPPENLDLVARIAQSGALVTEMPFGWEPRARDFPRRNRIIAGLGLGLVVVEAATRSGSLITARLAGDIGRMVFAVPGSPLDPRAEGSNGLLKDGAVLTLGVEDVVEHLRPMIADRRSGQRPGPSGGMNDRGTNGSSGGTEFEFLPADDAPPTDAHGVVLEALSPSPSHVDELVRHTGLSARVLTTVLLELDLAGRIERHPGGSVSILLEP